MLGERLEADFGAGLNGSTGQNPGAESPGAAIYAKLVEESGAGESAGNYRLFEIVDGKVTTIVYR